MSSELFYAVDRADLMAVKSLTQDLVVGKDNEATIATAKDFNGRTLLTRAARKGCLLMVEYLIERGACVNATNTDGSTSLMHAVEAKRGYMVDFLCARGADPNAQDLNGNTALHKIFSRNHVLSPPIAMDMITSLVGCGADMHAVDRDGETALHKLALHLTSRNENSLMDAVRDALLVAAVKAGNLARLRELITSAPTSNMKNTLAMLLIYAAKGDDRVMFEYLVEHGAVIPSKPEQAGWVARMLQHRRDWVHQATALAHQYRLPLIAVRVIHEYLVCFNWPSVCDAIRQTVFAETAGAHALPTVCRKH